MSRLSVKMGANASSIEVVTYMSPNVKGGSLNVIIKNDLGPH